MKNFILEENTDGWEIRENVPAEQIQARCQVGKADNIIGNFQVGMGNNYGDYGWTIFSDFKDGQFGHTQISHDPAIDNIFIESYNEKDSTALLIGSHIENLNFILYEKSGDWLISRCDKEINRGIYWDNNQQKLYFTSMDSIKVIKSKSWIDSEILGNDWKCLMKPFKLNSKMNLSAGIITSENFVETVDTGVRIFHDPDTNTTDFSEIFDKKRWGIRFIERPDSCSAGMYNNDILYGQWIDFKKDGSWFNYKYLDRDIVYPIQISGYNKATLIEVKKLKSNGLYDVLAVDMNIDLTIINDYNAQTNTVSAKQTWKWIDSGLQ